MKDQWFVSYCQSGLYKLSCYLCNMVKAIVLSQDDREIDPPPCSKNTYKDDTSTFTMDHFSSTLFSEWQAQ